MEYLEKARLVHCNLAARNIVLVNEEQVKITSFGMCRAIEEGSEYYVVRRGWES